MIAGCAKCSKGVGLWNILTQDVGNFVEFMYKYMLCNVNCSILDISKRNKSKIFDNFFNFIAQDV